MGEYFFKYIIMDKENPPKKKSMVVVAHDVEMAYSMVVERLKLNEGQSINLTDCKRI